MTYESRYYHNQDGQTNSWLLRKYQIDLEGYDALMEGQNGQCEICEKGILGGDENNRRLAVVDHCHATGIARTLLCGPCNSREGVVRKMLANGNVDDYKGEGLYEVLGYITYWDELYGVK